jgi:hypothetical protein
VIHCPTPEIGDEDFCEDNYRREDANLFGVHADSFQVQRPVWEKNSDRDKKQEIES